LWLDNAVLLRLTSFLDDSISSARDRLAITTIGGPVMSRISFKALGREWIPMLREYRGPPPLHMQDFVRPNGRHIGMPIEMKLSLFRDVVAIINRHKLYSFSISIPQDDFGELIPEPLQQRNSRSLRAGLLLRRPDESRDQPTQGSPKPGGLLDRQRLRPSGPSTKRAHSHSGHREKT
jgi:hypothetical protein